MAVCASPEGSASDAHFAMRMNCRLDTALSFKMGLNQPGLMYSDVQLENLSTATNQSTLAHDSSSANIVTVSVSFKKPPGGGIMENHYSLRVRFSRL